MALLAAGLLAGCGGSEPEAATDDAAPEIAAPAAEAAPASLAAPAAEPAAEAVPEPETVPEAPEAPDEQEKPPAKAEAPAPAAPKPKIETVAVAARPAAFAMCQTCHTTGRGEPHRVGPNLFGVVGAKAGSKPGYNYSDALKESGIAWSRDRLAAFIAAPRAVVPGTKMVIAGPKDAAKRQEIVDYLASLR